MGKTTLGDEWCVVVRERVVATVDFMEEVDRYWHEPIELLEKMRYVMIVAFDEGFDDANERSQSDELREVVLNRFTVLAQARACQLLGEIIALVRNGYAEGATAR